MMATRATPPGWTFVQQQNNYNSDLICRSKVATTFPAQSNWPAVQTAECESMPGCLAVSFSVELSSDGLVQQNFCFKISDPADPLVDAFVNGLMPQMCMGTMVRVGK